ncbi:hypothetical protein AB0L57_12510 [Nocardia sp. NPDC052254]|uniref:DUF7373 family lipoprotein n=1 Tax=Nocardia sp. NPDC052254 TaxID=3155681 RepID=UPI003447C38D
MMLMAVAASSTACDSGNSESVDPSPHINVSDLDVGGFTTSPGKVGSPNPTRARIMEGQRLGSVVPLAMEIDPRFKYQQGAADDSVYAWIDSQINAISNKNLEEDAKGFTAGFYTWARDDTDLLIAKSMSYSVMLFSDDVSARNAAKALYDREIGNNAFKPPEYHFQPVAIDGNPDVFAWWVSGEGTLESFKATGRFVINLSVSDGAKRKLQEKNLVDDYRGELIDLTAKSMSTISEAMKKFEATPPDRLAAAPVDHDDMLGRTLRRSPSDNADEAPGFYDQHTALHLSADPAGDAKLFADTGMEWMSSNGGRLYRAKNSASAQKIFEAHSAPGKLYRLIQPPKNLPMARCHEYRGDGYGNFRFNCSVRYNNYVAEISSNQLIDIYQRTSAQYAILESSL